LQQKLSEDMKHCLSVTLSDFERRSLIYLFCFTMY
jgi:hypothetical protein